MALYPARCFVAPVLSLAGGMRAVAQGNFSQTRPVFHNDESGRLIQSLNHMTEQLTTAKETDECNRSYEEAAHHYLECALESLTTGMVTLDADGCLKTFSRATEQVSSVSLVSL